MLQRGGMMASTRTKKLRLIAFLLTLLSILLTIGPLCVYSVKAFTNSQASSTDKCVLLSMLSIGTILSLVCIINKYTPRCRIWLVIIGLYLCLDSILGCILVIAITQVIDELIVAPIARRYREKLRINKEIDKRGI